MADNNECTSLTVLDAFSEVIDAELKEKIDSVVYKILQLDDRFQNPTIEIVDAVRDWVRAEAVLNKMLKDVMVGDVDASKERMLRAMLIQKNALRDEIFGKFKGKKLKDKEVEFREKILVDKGVIDGKVEVDILETNRRTP